MYQAFIVHDVKSVHELLTTYLGIMLDLCVTIFDL